ncbi:transposase DDE domain protein [Clostridium tepidiprofundi DSM 19306]|uniref:Transposase DDE domain protein n=1 Tax=Clostridium tepidiprofundi DSM 19306 TaxID=1121338 RepID=A0A151AR40_9CLOT|nr:transposase [Clostridium tepidiprofundi]KYH30050.1 transposase DDE domain protein [Clostridium tepidiprofundi DSM 19306]
MNTIIPNNDTEKKFKSTIDRFFKKNKIGSILKQSNFCKEKGFSCILIFKFIFMLVFTGKNLFRTLDSKNDITNFAKDVVYRFLNSTNYNWRKFLFLLSSSIIKNEVEPLSAKDRVNVLIVDDSFYSRTRSKSVELLANVFDHVDRKYKKGFRMLTLGWSDGNTFLPLAFTLLSSEKEKNRICPINSTIDKRTNGYKIRTEAVKKAPEVMIDLLKQAAAYALPATYVLFDSWFTYPKTLIKILELNLHTIAMVKAMPKVFYTYEGKKYNLRSLYSTIKKKRGKAKIKASVIVEIGQDSHATPIKAKIVFVKDKNSSKNWLALISTDVTLSDEEIIRIYGKRWDIEVFFKMNKSFLNLAKEFQGRSYDSMVAHTTIVFTRYIMLSIESRNNTDIRTVGALFYYCCDELQDIQFFDAIQLILDLLKSALYEKLSLTKEQINSFLDYFISTLPTFIKEKLAFL